MVVRTQRLQHSHSSRACSTAGDPPPPSSLALSRGSGEPERWIQILDTGETESRYCTLRSQPNHWATDLPPLLQGGGEIYLILEVCKGRRLKLCFRLKETFHALLNQELLPIYNTFSSNISSVFVPPPRPYLSSSTEAFFFFSPPSIFQFIRQNEK